MRDDKGLRESVSIDRRAAEKRFLDHLARLIAKKHREKRVDVREKSFPRMYQV